MKLNTDQVKYVAKLASLPLDENSTDVYADQLSKILDYIKQLDQVDVEKVKPTYNVSNNETVFRDDEIYQSLPQDTALQNANNARDGYFVTKGVFEPE